MTAEPEKTHVVKELAHKSPLIACRFHPGGRFVFASSEDNSVQRWDLETGKRHSAGRARELGLRHCGSTRRRRDHHRRGRRPAHLVGRHRPRSPSLCDGSRRIEAGSAPSAISPDGSVVASCGNDRMIRLWSFADGKPLLELPGHDRPVYRLLFTPGGRTLISADLRGLVIEWDYRPGKEARRLDAGKLYQYNAGQGVDYGGVRDLSLSRDGKYLACGGLIEASNPLGRRQQPGDRRSRLADQPGGPVAPAQGKRPGAGLWLAISPRRVPDRGFRRQCRAVSSGSGSPTRSTSSSSSRCPTPRATWTCTPTASASPRPTTTASSA